MLGIGDPTYRIARAAAAPKLDSGWDDAVRRGNFYKCAEDNSHPHWASWASMGGELNFHLPDRFGWFSFE